MKIFSLRLPPTGAYWKIPNAVPVVLWTTRGGAGLPPRTARFPLCLPGSRPKRPSNGRLLAGVA